jgi:hypothetical protein
MDLESEYYVITNMQYKSNHEMYQLIVFDNYARTIFFSFFI